MMLLLVSLVLVQAAPDFTGRWVAVEPGAMTGHELRITQEQDNMILEQGLQNQVTYDEFGKRRPVAEGRAERARYRLDGRAVTWSRGEVRMISTAKLKNGRLTLTDNQVGSPGPLRFERTLELDSQGRLVLVHRHPATTGDDSAASSQAILEPQRIVFEKR